VKEVGAGVTEFAVGDLIAADIGLIESCSDPAPASGTAGAFAELTCVPAKLAVKVPAGVDMDTAAGLALAGLTVVVCETPG
jgi:NADPH:quinone reductase-like Zn-dependent oxidoreductase